MAEDSKNDGIGSFEKVGGETGCRAAQRATISTPSIIQQYIAYHRRFAQLSEGDDVGLLHFGDRDKGWSDQVPKGEPGSIADGMMRIPTRP